MAKKGFNGLMAMTIEESKNQWSDDFNNSEDSDFYKLAASFMPAFVYLEDKVISLKRSYNIYTCQGQELDDIINNDVLPRILGNKSKGIFTVKGIDKTFVDHGEIQVEAFNGETFTNIGSGNILNGVLDVEFVCDNATSGGNFPANNIERVIKAPAGINDVQNSNPTTGGLDVETDYEYLKRYLESNTGSEWVLSAIIAEVKKVPGVTSASGDRNNTMTDNTGSQGLPPKSIRIIAKGGDEQEICDAIYRKIHTPNTVGLITKNVEVIPGKNEAIRFDRPTETAIDYRYNIMADKKTEVLALLVEYLNELGINDFISSEDFRNKKIGISQDYGIKALSIQFKRSSETPYSDFIQLKYDEEGKAGTGASV